MSFIHNEAAAGFVLVVAAVLAIIVFNIDPLRPHYIQVFSTQVNIGYGDLSLSKPFLLWINDGLMAIFFLLIGLELKREVLEGHLSSSEQIILPAFSAIGGMVAPALIYLWINGSNVELIQGWAIPAATDIAFALGALSIVGRSVPISLKIFLLALATLDDLGAIIVIALFYTPQISWEALAYTGVAVSCLILLNRIRADRTWYYLVTGAALWFWLLKSGVHATLAGVILGLSIPLRDRNGRLLLYALEQRLHTVVKFLILPIFAFANTGIPIASLSPVNAVEALPLGIAAGLTIGKPAGILFMCWVAVRLGFSGLPQGCNWIHILGVGFIAGIGFTMSLFIGSLAFPSETLAPSVRVGVIYGSLLSSAIGLLVLKTARKQDER